MLRFSQSLYGIYKFLKVLRVCGVGRPRARSAYRDVTPYKNCVLIVIGKKIFVAAEAWVRRVKFSSKPLRQVCFFGTRSNRNGLLGPIKE